MGQGEASGRRKEDVGEAAGYNSVGEGWCFGGGVGAGGAADPARLRTAAGTTAAADVSQHLSAGGLAAAGAADAAPPAALAGTAPG